jgi:hypothetical protein
VLSRNSCEVRLAAHFETFPQHIWGYGCQEHRTCQMSLLQLQNS